MKFILFIGYWILGFVMIIGVSCAIGLAICTIIAFFKAISRPKNILLAFGYLTGASLVTLLVWAGFFFAGWIGDHTNYAGQFGMLVGAIVPGIGSLVIIPQFAKVAMRQTSGLEV